MKHADARAHAVVMRRYGPPDVLVFEEVVLPPLAPDEVRLRTLASPVNHSDLEIRAGNWPVQRANPFPYVPGLEVLGEVVETGTAVSGFREGDRAITMMQGLGGVRAHRPGGYAEYVTAAASAAALVAPDVDPLEIAALGLVAVTAHEGLRAIGALDGRRVLVTGAAGGVGSAAVGIAAAQGASVVAVVTRPEQVEYVRSLGAVEVVLRDRRTGGAPLEIDPVHAVLDAVGGDLFGPCVGALRPGGTLCLVGAVAGSEVRFDAYQLMQPVSLTGYSSEDLDGPALRGAIEALSGWLRRGKLRPPARRVLPLVDAASAHAMLERGGGGGRLLLVP